MRGFTNNPNFLNNSELLQSLLLLLTAACFILSAAGTALAAGTASGTIVSLGATADYQVGGVSMPPVSTASPAEFMVDTVVDLTVAETGSNYTTVTPGATGQVLTFTVQNTGNATHDFDLSAAVVAVGGDDPIDGGTNTVDFTATDLQVFVDANANGTYDVATDTAIYIDELAADATITVFIIANIPTPPVNDDVAACTLIATAHDGGSAGSLGALTVENAGDPNDTSTIPANVDVVFGDGSGLVDDQVNPDGAHSAGDAFLVTSATLTISKSSVVISDPFNGTTNPKMIPGAVVEYTITVTNDAGAGQSATNIQVQDDLTAEIGNIAFDPDAYGPTGSGLGIQYTINDTIPYTILTNASDGDNGSFASNTVSVGSITLPPGDHADIQFRVIIQ